MEFKFKTTYKHINRYRQISQVLIKNGLGFVVEWLDLGKYLPFNKKIEKQKKINKKNLAKRIRLVLQELGPTYIKFGQLLSTRADILSPEYIEELRELQDEIPGIEYEEIEQVLIKELGKNYEEYFINIEKKPVAAASIAQIHQATLKSGEEVVLKIQRPGIKKKIEVDLEILSYFAKLLNERDIIPEFIEPSKILSEFENELNKEIDFKREIANINRFKKNFSDNKHIIIPDIYEDLSSRRLIIMEEIKGIKLKEVSDANRDKIKAPFLARLGARALFKQVLIDGFFHADTHPGNIFVVDQNKLAYIDFGLVGQITDEDTDVFATLFIALLKQDVDIIVEKLIEIGITFEKINRRKLKLDIKDLLNRYYSRSLKEIDFSLVFDDMQRIIYKYHIRMPEEFYLLMRAIGVSEGVGVSLDPNFNLVDMSDQLVRDLIKDRFSFKNLSYKLFKKLWGIRKTTKKIPNKLDGLLDKLVNDKFTVQFEHSNLEPLIDKLDIVSNRLSISLIITALIIGSSMVIQTNMKPHLLGIPLLGFLGYIVAGVLGLWLVFSILRSGKF
jgi:ubiquinone biosynthesis protein